jgi:hypothetical protein
LIDHSCPPTLRSQPLIFALGCARPSLATESNGNARQPVSEALCSLPQLANGHASARLVAKESSAESKFVHVARAPISRSPVPPNTFANELHRAGGRHMKDSVPRRTIPLRAYEATVAGV